VAVVSKAFIDRRLFSELLISYSYTEALFAVWLDSLQEMADPRNYIRK